MEVQTFWSIVESSLSIYEKVKLNQSSGDEFLMHLVDTLKIYKEDEIIDYHRLFNQHRGAIWKRSTHQIGAIILGDLDNDGFEWFCTWLVYSGKSIYSSFLNNPDDFADFVDKNHVFYTLGCEAITQLADITLESKHKGQEFSYKKYPSYIHSFSTLDWVDDVDTTEYYSDEELATTYPKMWAKFGE